MICETCGGIFEFDYEGVCPNCGNEDDFSYIRR